MHSAQIDRAMRPDPGRRLRDVPRICTRLPDAKSPCLGQRRCAGVASVEEGDQCVWGTPVRHVGSVPAEEYRRLTATRQVKEDKINRGRNIPICSSELRGPNDPQIVPNMYFNGFYQILRYFF